ncbi:MAG: hypothetical protein FAF03_12120 [Epsilonproteobacteria bacterium]|nr:hypothetical protein [Campylobacterota bacterium]
MSNWIREAKYVEEKFLEELYALKWDIHVIDDSDNKYRTDKALLGRTSFKEVLLTDRLTSAIRRINGSWLKDEQVKEVISTLSNINETSLFENNLSTTQLLIENTSVDLNHDTGAKSPTVKYLDFETGDNHDGGLVG